jgi:hypothetical protein
VGVIEWLNSVSGILAGIALVITSASTIISFINQPFKQKEAEYKKTLQALEDQTKEQRKQLEELHKQQSMLMQFIILESLTKAIEKGFRNELLTPYLTALYQSYEDGYQLNHISQNLFQEYFRLPTEVEYLKQKGKYNPSEETTKYMHQVVGTGTVFDEQRQFIKESRESKESEKDRWKH